MPTLPKTLTKTGAYILFLFLFACATIKPPIGGIKDEIPPKIEKMIPENFSTQFNGDRVVLFFDEYVQLNNIYEQLLVSPPLNERPEIYVKGRSVVMEFKEELRKNTTYTIFFGAGIADNNEKNILDSNKVVFSTGEVLDSLMISGSVKLANSDEPFSCGVLLFESSLDSAIVKESPAYYTESDELGNFMFENLAKGKYQVFALEDMDGDYNWTENERMAFLDEPVLSASSDSIKHPLFLFTALPIELRINTSKVNAEGTIDLTFNQDVDSLRLEEIGFSYDNRIIEEFSKDSLKIWYKGILSNDRSALKISSGTEVIDTLDLFVFETRKAKEYPELVLLSSKRQTQNPNEDLRISFSNPIVAIDQNQIVMQLDTVIVEAEYEIVSKKDVSSMASFKDHRLGSILFLPGAVTDIYGQKNDTITSAFKILTESDYGSLNLSIQLPHQGNFILQTEIDGALCYTTFLEKDTLVNWSWVKPGKVEFLLIEDSNDNKIWDSGDYFKNKQPEKTWKFSGDIQLRPNWTLDQEWNLKED